MSSLIPVVTLLLAGAISPGPNNLVVMRTAAREGFGHALPAVAGVVLGSVVLLAVVVAGADHAFRAWPLLRGVVAIGGAAYLVVLGVSLIARSRDDRAGTALPAGVLGLFGFQFLNPKGWVLVLTVVAAIPASGAVESFVRLAPLFIAVPAVCLLLWAGLGSALTGQLARPAVRIATDRVLGILLVASALLLIV